MFQRSMKEQGGKEILKGEMQTEAMSHNFKNTHRTAQTLITAGQVKVKLKPFLSQTLTEHHSK